MGDSTPESAPSRWSIVRVAVAWQIENRLRLRKLDSNRDLRSTELRRTSRHALWPINASGIESSFPPMTGLGLSGASPYQSWASHPVSPIRQTRSAFSLTPSLPAFDLRSSALGRLRIDGDRPSLTLRVTSSYEKQKSSSGTKSVPPFG